MINFKIMFPFGGSAFGGKKYFILFLAIAGFAVAASVQASVISGNLTTGLSSGPQVVVVVAPSATPVAGTYTSAQSVVLSATGSQSIHYTVDGSAPTCTTGTVYSSAISVAASKTIKALSCYPDNHASEVVSFAYVINIQEASPPASPQGTGGGGSGSGGGGGSGSGGGSGGLTTGSIAGKIFSDVDANGQYNSPTDTPLSNWAVYLDANNNSVLDSGETSILSDSSGNYLFSNLAFATYNVREVVKTGWGQTLPPASSNNHAHSVIINSSIPNATGKDFGNNSQGQVLGETTINAHPNGTLILDGQTIYLIEAGKRRGFRDPVEYQSYGYNFTQTVSASDADKLLPLGDLLKAMTGTLTLDKSDNKTVYMVGKNFTKRGFASYEVFQGLGYAKGSGMSGQAVKGMYKINMTDYAAGLPITSATEAHPEGALVRESNGTVWWILDGKRSGFESEAVFSSYGFTFDRTVPANAADLALAQGFLVKFRDGTLVKDGTVYYIISDGKSRAFSSVSSLTSLGYKISNVISASLSAYEKGETIY